MILKKKKKKKKNRMTQSNSKKKKKNRDGWKTESLSGKTTELNIFVTNFKKRKYEY